MDFSKVNKKDLISDLVKVATFNIVGHVLLSATYNEPIVSEKFLYSLIYILFGFALYHIFIHQRLMNLVTQYFGLRRAISKSIKQRVAKFAKSSKPLVAKSN